MVRIVAVADTHLVHKDLKVPDGDVLVHAGDMCRRGSLEELEVAAQFFLSLPHRHKVVVAGNHDWSFVNQPEEARRLLGDAVYLEGSGAEVAGLRFWGGPWQPEYNDWAFNLPPGEPLAEKWARIPDGLDVLVTHGPPRGIGDKSGYSEVRGGDEELLRRVRQVRPRLHLFGHIHEDGGNWHVDGTTFVNCTTWECGRAPTVIDVDERSVCVR
jgi:Icc-related predicted phosphoesterase